MTYLKMLNCTVNTVKTRILKCINQHNILNENQFEFREKMKVINALHSIT